MDETLSYKGHIVFITHVDVNVLYKTFYFFNMDLTRILATFVE
jgi:hypothetical protein